MHGKIIATVIVVTVLLALGVYFVQSNHLTADTLPGNTLLPSPVDLTAENPSPTAQPHTPTPEVTQELSAIPVDVVKRYYAAFTDCMQNPPADAGGRVQEYCQTHNDYVGTELAAKLDAQATQGYVPVICAQNPPTSANPTGTPVITEEKATIVLSEQFGSVSPVAVTYELTPEGEGNPWKVQNIICPKPE